MGCRWSGVGGATDDDADGSFRVVNVDERGRGLWAGRLEVGVSELVLRRRGRSTVRWPLRSLRRYGREGDMFSFESGRRCPTGEGIYAFRCRRADRLFDALQRSIRAEDVQQQQQPTPPLPSAAMLPSCSTNSTNLYQVRDFNERNNNAKDAATNDVNADLAALRHSLPTRRFDDEPERYATLAPPLPADDGDGDELAKYANLDDPINYAVLDLEPDEPPPTSPKIPPQVGYTTIDFNKTEALTSVAQGNDNDTEGSRRTRHNSTAPPPPPSPTR